MPNGGGGALHWVNENYSYDVVPYKPPKPFPRKRKEKKMDKKVKKTFPKVVYVWPDFPYKSRPKKEGDWWLCEESIDMIDDNTDVGVYELKEVKKIKRRTTLE